MRPSFHPPSISSIRAPNNPNKQQTSLQYIHMGEGLHIHAIAPRDHITPTLKRRHCLPMLSHIAFKISLLVYHIDSGTSPSYTTSMDNTMYSGYNYVMLPILEDSDCSREENFPFNAQTASLQIVPSLFQDLNNGTVFQLQFVDAHLLLSLNKN